MNNSFTVDNGEGPILKVKYFLSFLALLLMVVLVVKVPHLGDILNVYSPSSSYGV